MFVGRDKKCYNIINSSVQNLLCHFLSNGFFVLMIMMMIRRRRRRRRKKRRRKRRIFDKKKLLLLSCTRNKYKNKMQNCKKELFFYSFSNIIFI